MFDLLENHKTVKLLHAVFAADRCFDCLQANLTQNITSNIPASISINTEHPHPLLLVDCVFDNVNCLYYI